MKRALIQLLGATVCSVFMSAATAPAEEFRAVWVTRFEWPRTNAVACRAAIDEIMRTLAVHRFNAVMFQIRGQCDTLYPSPEEPWSPLISPDGSSPGFDPLAYAIQAAHANKLEFHAYINTHVAWQSAKHELPAAATHVFYQHFYASDPRACDWLAHDANGYPVQWGEDDYVWIAPGVPAVQAYTRRQIMYVVMKYDIDGVHLDRIRTGGADFSHDPISMARFHSEQANPLHLSFDAWTCDQINRFCRDLYAQIVEAKPRVKLSSAPLGLTSHELYPEYPPEFHYAVAKAHQDARAWLAAGAMDFVVPQIYWSDSDDKQPDFSRVLPDWLDHAAGRHIYAGLHARCGAAELAHEIQVTRQGGGLGNVVFSYAELKKGKRFASLSRRSRGVYADSAEIPAMPWRNTPSDGIIIGTVSDAATGQPVVDAQVRRTGSDDVALTSADGIYSFLKVPFGRCNLDIVAPGRTELRIEDVDIVAGKVVRVDAALNPEAASAPPITNEPVAEGKNVASTQPTAEHPRAKVISTETTVERPMPAAMSWLLAGMLVVGTVLGALTVWVVMERRHKGC